MQPSPLDTAQALLLSGRAEESLAAFDALLTANPADLHALFGRTNALKVLGRLAEAHAGYDAILAQLPGAVGALNNRGEVLTLLGKPELALADFNRALQIKPDFVDGYYYRGNALIALWRHEEALADFSRAIAAAPDFSESHVGRGIALTRLNRLPEALTSLDRAIAIWPENPNAHFHRALVLEKLGETTSAIQAYDRVIALQPDSLASINNRAVALHSLRLFAEAARGYAALEKMAPDIALNGLAICAAHACDWSHSEEYRTRLAAAIREGKAAILPGILLAYSDDPELMLACIRNSLQDKLPPSPKPHWRGTPFSGDKIKLAYCSADFHSHATAYLIAELFERHDRSRFEVIGISFGEDDATPMRQRVVKSFDQIHDVRFKSDAEIAALMADLGVDIAIDLKGLTREARIGIFAHRPAPVQVNYLGFPGTMGVDFMDYIIADAIVLPREQQRFYPEKIIQLPDCYQVNDSKRPLPAAPGRMAAGLPASGFVFCCFNNNYKITAPLFDIWMRLLNAVPGSVLWLIEDSREAADNLRRNAAQRGVAPDRLVFAPRTAPDDHIARHRLADLFLDTLPYNAHTTASDSLWAGVPLVTCKGKGFPGRVAASILSAAGLPELITENLDDYEKLALALATDAPRLAALKKKLEAARTTAPLFDIARFTAGMEAAFERMRDDFRKI